MESRKSPRHKTRPPTNALAFEGAIGRNPGPSPNTPNSLVLHDSEYASVSTRPPYRNTTSDAETDHRAGVRVTCLLSHSPGAHVDCSINAEPSASSRTSVIHSDSETSRYSPTIAGPSDRSVQASVITARPTTRPYGLGLFHTLRFWQPWLHHPLVMCRLTDPPITCRRPLKDRPEY